MTLAELIREIRLTYPADLFDIIVDEAGTLIGVTSLPREPDSTVGRNPRPGKMSDQVDLTD